MEKIGTGKCSFATEVKRYEGLIMTNNGHLSESFLFGHLPSERFFKIAIQIEVSSCSSSSRVLLRATFSHKL